MNQLTINDIDRIKEKWLAEQDKYKAMLMICAGTGCISAGSLTLYELFVKELKERGLSNEYLPVPTGCNGFCAKGPIIVVQPEGIFYQKVKEKDIPVIIEQHLKGGKPVEDLLYKDTNTGEAVSRMNDISFFGKQMLIALRNRGIINPEVIDSAIARGAYKALSKALTQMSPEDIINEIKASAIRGRGGGGFPAGVKWESCYEAAKKRNEKPYVVCNGDEGDPGAFMDRSIVEADPHSVIEGMAICARAIGAEQGYVYIRKEYPLALSRLLKAIKDARSHGLLGKNILDTGFSFDINIHQGAGAFVCGESTALMASMEGKVGEPRAKYIHSVEYGYRNKPTVLNNVETLVNIPLIIEKGAKWFTSIGSGDVSQNPWGGSAGTKVFSLVGNIVNSGLVEVPMGITLREIIFDIGGGIPNGRKFKAVQTGGPSGGCIPESLLDMPAIQTSEPHEHHMPESLLDMPVDFDKLTGVGSMMGSGGMIVMDNHTCMVDVAKYFINFLKDESCGKCTPCREGLILLDELLGKIIEGKGEMKDLDSIKQICETMKTGSLCGLGQTAPNPVLSTFKYFQEEYINHIKNKKCPAGKCKALIEFSINDKCTGCAVCAKNCPAEAITGVPKEKYSIDQNKCIKCGICEDVCKFEAVTVQ